MKLKAVMLLLLMPYIAFGQGNIYETDVMPGEYGGACTCPDGQVYQVADNLDWCGSLACIGGTSGECNSREGPWSKNRVTCAVKEYNYMGCYKNQDADRMRGHTPDISFVICAAASSGIFGMEYPQAFTTAGNAECLQLAMIPNMQKMSDVDCEVETDTNGHRLGGYYRLAVYSTELPTMVPSAAPSATPTDAPTVTPTCTPTFVPTELPTMGPSAAPSATPTDAPTEGGAQCAEISWKECDEAPGCRLVGRSCFSEDDDEIPCSAYLKSKGCPVETCMWEGSQCVDRTGGCAGYSEKNDCINFGQSCYWAKECRDIPDDCSLFEKSHCNKSENINKDLRCSWNKEVGVCVDSVAPTCATQNNKGKCRKAGRLGLSCAWDKGNNSCSDTTSCHDLRSQDSCENASGTKDCDWLATVEICVDSSELSGGSSVEGQRSCNQYSKKGACKRRENWPAHEDGRIVCKWISGACSASDLTGCLNFADASQCRGSLAISFGCVWNSSLRICFDP